MVAKSKAFIDHLNSEHNRNIRKIIPFQAKLFYDIKELRDNIIVPIVTNS